jgi:hypothetical protein
MKDSNTFHDMTLKYDGRVLVVTAVVNTAADPYDIQKRVNRALRGDRLDAVIVKIEGYSGAAGALAWKAAQAVSTKIAAHPKAQSTDEPFKPTGAMDELRDIAKGMPAGALDEATVQDAIMVLERANADLVARGLSAPELAGLEIGAGVRLLRESGASREKVLEACALLWDDTIDAALGVDVNKE